MRLPSFHLRLALGFACLLGPSSALSTSPLIQEELTKAAPIQATERWTEREVEHLLNRAGFGASLGEIRRWKNRGRAALIDHLFDRPGPSSEFPVRNFRVDRSARAKAGPDERMELDRKVRREDRKQVQEFAEWWLDQMVRGRDPLRERMTLILHGWMVSSHDKVRQGDYLIRQNFLFRQHALGNYGDLLGHIVEDPAMLLYLDNTSNRKNKPNENLARELLELFSLGEGHYTEQDIKEAARALTGYTVRFDDFYYVLRNHDRESKTVLGDDTVGDAIDLVRVILEQPACAEYVARRVISEMEGVAPTAERTAQFAAILRSEDYEFEPMLRALFADPQFYRDEVVGTKVLSPVEFMVGHSRRGQWKPDTEFLYAASAALGQTLMEPPSVKGWDGGFAWLTESSFLLRSNLWGGVLGQISPKDLRDQVAAAVDEMDGLMGGGESGGGMQEEGSGQETAPEPKRRGGPLARILTTIRREKMAIDFPILSQLGERRIVGDQAIANHLLDRLLAIDAPAETRLQVRQFIKKGRKQLKIKSGKLHEGGVPAKKLLMRTIHLILSLPEAQLH